MSYSENKAPLHGVKVLDLTRVLAGPLATMMLGDMGASIIKVERPGTGDDTRGWGPPFDPTGQSAYFLSINRNKLSITADFSAPDDVARIRQLAADADVVVENFRPGVLERFGLGADELRGAHPRLIWCSIGSFEGDPSRPGYDAVTQAESGWMAITGEPEGAPMKVGVALADVVAGKDAVIAILGALHARGIDGVGRHVQVWLDRSAESALVNVAQSVLVSGSDARRWGNQHGQLVPYQLFEAADRALVIAVGTDAQWMACAKALDLEDLARDASLARNAGRVRDRERVVEAVARRVRARTADEVRDRLVAVGVPCGVVRSVREVVTAAGADAVTGLVPSVGGPPRLPPPRLGEHDAIVRERGWGAFD